MQFNGDAKKSSAAPLAQHTKLWSIIVPAQNDKQNNIRNSECRLKHSKMQSIENETCAAHNVFTCSILFQHILPPATDSRFLFAFSLQTEVKINLFRGENRLKAKRRRTKGRGTAAQLINVHHINSVASIAIVVVGGGGDDSVFICMNYYLAFGGYWKLWLLYCALKSYGLYLLRSFCTTTPDTSCPRLLFRFTTGCRQIRVSIRVRSQCRNPRKTRTNSQSTNCNLHARSITSHPINGGPKN